MSKLVFLFFTAVFTASFCPAQFTTTVQRIWSSQVKDSFDIYISVPAGGKTEKFDQVIYYMDANLKSGKRLRQSIENDSIYYNKKYLYIGVGHTGNFHKLRRRDFIPPLIIKGDTVPKSGDYGQIENFYRFLQSELIPFIEKKYPVKEDRTIMGHSLGGLFAVYCLFRNEGLFDSYIALSPALWIDKYSIYSFNHIKQAVTKPVHFIMVAGSREDFNKILAGFRKMNSFLEKKKYEGLKFGWHIYAGTHNSYIKDQMADIITRYILH